MRRYHAKHYYKNRPEQYVWIGPFRVFIGHEKKDINEPEWRSLSRFRCGMRNSHNNQAKYWYRWSNRRFRRIVKKLIHQGRYDDLPVKPDNVDWTIC